MAENKRMKGLLFYVVVGSLMEEELQELELLTEEEIGELKDRLSDTYNKYLEDGLCRPEYFLHHENDEVNVIYNRYIVQIFRNN